ncbi:MAG: glycosyltransferase [Planctomycetales bacterium]|nr:glycosyltransferase [Planctomycetales bacterium]
MTDAKQPKLATESWSNKDPAGSNGPLRIAVFFDRLGPYHLARLNAAVAAVDVHGIELNRRDADYAWDLVNEDDVRFRRYALFESSDQIPAFGALLELVRARLDEIAPAVVAVHGWSPRAALAALCWCRENRVPAIVMSESSARDARRSGVAEWVKSRVVRQFSAALVGGRTHRDYFQKLGASQAQCFLGYDAIDNAYFAAGATSARANSESMRLRYKLPTDYFLASSRFIEKKNLLRLLAAYGEYSQRMGSRRWNLVILGDGELRAEIETLIGRLGLADAVQLPGFRQYGELPAYYGLARAFVHASTVEQWGLVVNEAMASGLPILVSTTCGCAAELVCEGENGWAFDPYSGGDIVRTLLAAHRNSDRLAAMGAKSREIIMDWGPERFASGLLDASQAALAAGSPPLRVGDLALLRVLGRAAK